MAETQGPPNAGFDQISTLDAGPAPMPPVGQASAPAAPRTTGPSGATLAPGKGNDPDAAAPGGDPSDQATGVGTLGEVDVWIGYYSLRNFLGRILGLSIFSLAGAALAIYAWGYDHKHLEIPATIGGIILGLLWAGTAIRIIRARLGHKYRLSNRRLFVSSGIFHRETDQLELLRVQDVFNRQQSLMDRVFNVGSVIIVSDQKSMPNYVLLGVADPKGTMDLIWHHARAEQDRRNVRVEHI